MGASTADSAEIAARGAAAGTPTHHGLDAAATPGELNEGEGEEGAFRIVNFWLSNFATADPFGLYCCNTC